MKSEIKVILVSTVLAFSVGSTATHAADKSDVAIGVIAGIIINEVLGEKEEKVVVVEAPRERRDYKEARRHKYRHGHHHEDRWHARYHRHRYHHEHHAHARFENEGRSDHDYRRGYRRGGR